MFRRRSVQLFFLFISVITIVFYGGHGLCKNFAIVYPRTQIFPTDAQRGIEFGFNVAGDGNTLIASTNPRIGLSIDVAVYVYTRSENNQWLQQAKLIPRAGRVSVGLGNSIDISGDTIVVVDQSHSSVYVFVRKESNWTLQAELPPPEDAGVNFGRDIAIDGDTIVVGDNEAAHIYVRQPGTRSWLYQTKLVAPANSEGYFAFGSSVDISGDIIVVGIGKSNGGIASVFVRNPRTNAWEQQAELMPQRIKKQRGFGGSVSIDANRIVIGDYRELLGSEPVPTGAAYVFERNSNKNTWLQTAKLVPKGARKGFLAPYGFGTRTVLKGNVVAVLAKNYSSLFAGLEAPVYLFECDSKGQWTQQVKMLPNRSFPNEAGFASVAVWNNTIAAGEIFAKKQEIITGAVHILDIPNMNSQSPN
ncbi:hypothetical protein H6F87_23980 [Cyanobacteria bacterium FACHB-502]|uniref:hypothetical protein n=2 Tax=unclassified Leptolyngbya TaxID=2650499 RepID=UPI00198D72EA|nr:hypothetical protein [Cyanobacteria bacterium FACHB-502]